MVMNSDYISKVFSDVSKIINIETMKIYRKMMFQSLNDKKFNLTLISRVNSMVLGKDGYEYFLFDTRVRVPRIHYNTRTTETI